MLRGYCFRLAWSSTLCASGRFGMPHVQACWRTSWLYHGKQELCSNHMKLKDDKSGKKEYPDQEGINPGVFIDLVTPHDVWFSDLAVRFHLDAIPLTHAAGSITSPAPDLANRVAGSLRRVKSTILGTSPSSLGENMPPRRSSRKEGSDDTTASGLSGVSGTSSKSVRFQTS